MLRLLLVVVILIFASGCTTSGNVGKTCTQFADRQVRQSYCAQEAAQTCRTYCDSYGCRTNCGGGGYCVATASRMITVRECVAFVCQAGYQRFDGGCYTSEQIQVRKERRADNALSLVSRQYDVPRNGDYAIYLAGRALTLGQFDIEADPARAAAFYERECDQGRAGGCYGLGRMHLAPQQGVPANADPTKGQALMSKACDLNYGAACSALADRIRPPAEGTGESDRTADYRPAAALYERACSNDDAWGCSQAATLYERSLVSTGYPGARAYELYDRGCNTRGSLQSTAAAAACLNAARYIYSGVDNLAPDESRARRFVKRAIKLSERTAENDPVTKCILEGRGSCGLDVADARLGSAGLITDYYGATAAELMEAASQLNWGAGGVRKDNILARAYAQRACELRDGLGCRFAGELAWFSEEDLVGPAFSIARLDELSTNRSQAVALFRKSCNLGHGFGCRMLGNVLYGDNPVFNVVSSFGVPHDPQPDADLSGAFEAFRQGCEAGNPLGCRDAAQMLLTDRVDDPTPTRSAYALFSKGCELAVEFLSGDACVYAARLVYNGATDVPRDRARAAKLMAIALQVSTDEEPYAGKSSLDAPKVGHCILQAAQDEC
ncbi:MAG: hypothetical protein AAFX44_06115 [Pseudomonadota bacterium]